MDSKEYVNVRDAVVYFSDLDNDGKSEKIIAQTNTLGNASYLIYDSNNDLLDQYNYSGEFLSISKSLWFQDVDNNNISEIYFVTKRNDSAFLNIYEPIQWYTHNSKEIFVDTIAKYQGEDVSKVLNYSETSFLPHQGSEKVLFSISTGYSCYPRKVYHYSNINDRLISSPYLTNNLSIAEQFELKNDDENVYLLTGHSPGNEGTKKYSDRSDYSSWLTMLDNNLNFLFDPIEFSASGVLYPVVFESSPEQFGIWLFNSMQYEKTPSSLTKVSKTGEILKTVVLPRGYYRSMFKNYDDEIAVYVQDKGLLHFYDQDLNFIKQATLSENVLLIQFDFNFDGVKEWAGIDPNNTYATIWDSNLKNPVTFEYLGLKGPALLSHGIKLSPGSKKQIYFQRGNEIRFFTYQKNPLYPYEYLIFLGINATVLLFILLILKGQKIRDEKRLAIEREISDLQLKAIKNQVDPHFVFNAMNTISAMKLMDNQIEADRFICELSDLMRKTLSRSDKVSTTLKDELDYVKNYLRLQMMRFNNKFDFKIKVGKLVNTEQLIPKHSIFTFVENSVKYGLPANKKGLITIAVSGNKNELYIVVEDNGKGLKEEVNKRISTGNGLKIIQNIFDLYSNRFKAKIDHQVSNITTADNEITGTRVEVKMHFK